MPHGKREARGTHGEKEVARVRRQARATATASARGRARARARARVHLVSSLNSSSFHQPPTIELELYIPLLNRGGLPPG